MSSMGGKTPATARNSAYNTNAMEQIKNELKPFANVGAAHQVSFLFFYDAIFKIKFKVWNENRE